MRKRRGGMSDREELVPCVSWKPPAAGRVAGPHIDTLARGRVMGGVWCFLAHAYRLAWRVQHCVPRSEGGGARMMTQDTEHWTLNSLMRVSCCLPSEPTLCDARVALMLTLSSCCRRSARRGNEKLLRTRWRQRPARRVSQRLFCVCNFLRRSVWRSSF